jgi:hypothetical protein
MSAPGTIEQLRDPDLDPLLDGIRATHIPFFENLLFFARNIPPVRRSAKPPQKNFFDNFRQFQKKYVPFWAARYI